MIMLGTDMDSLMHIDNKKILIFGRGPTYGLDGTRWLERKYFTEEQKKLCFRLHHNGINNYIFVNSPEIC